MVINITNQSTELSAPLVGVDVKSDFLDKTLSRLRQINDVKKAFAKDERVLGIFKNMSYPTGHIVLTNYRLFGVKSAESHGNVVFTKELVGSDLQFVTIQAKKGLFNQIIYYDVDVESDGKNVNYATIKAADADNTAVLLEKIQSDASSLPLIVDSQEQLEKIEKVERDKFVAEQKQQLAEQASARKMEFERKLTDARTKQNNQANERKDRSELERQAKIDIKRNAKVALNKARGSLLGNVDIKYIGGYDTERHSGSCLYLYEGRLEYRDVFFEPSIVVNADDIAGFNIGGQQETKSRFTVTRMLAFGVFALASPKRTSVKEATVTIALKDGRQLLFITKSYTEHEVYKKLINGISYYSKLQASRSDLSQYKNKLQASAAEKPSQAFQLSQIDLLEKYAALHKEGVLTDEEFNAKKRQLLEL